MTHSYRCNAGLCLCVRVYVQWQGSTVLLFSVFRPVYDGVSQGVFVCDSKANTHTHTHTSDIRKWWKPNESWHFSPWKLSISWALFWGSGALNSMSPWRAGGVGGGGGGWLGWGPKEGEGVGKAGRSFKDMFIRLIEHYISLDNRDVSCHSGTKRPSLPLLTLNFYQWVSPLLSAWF